MVGNDVIDLADPETKSDGLNPRFDKRVFTADERRRLCASKQPHGLRWTMWAAKESAYKLAKRVDPHTIFAHSLFETSLDEKGFGSVLYGAWSCAIAVNREGNSIHAIATLDHRGFRRIVAGLDRLSQRGDPSAQVRELAQSTIARHLDIEVTAVTITTGPDRIPELRVDEVPTGHLSLSHHGAFVAFAWMPASPIAPAPPEPPAPTTAPEEPAAPQPSPTTVAPPSPAALEARERKLLK